MQFALSVVSSGCYEDDADEGEVMTLTGQPALSCTTTQHVALLQMDPGWLHAGSQARRYFLKGFR